MCARTATKQSPIRRVDKSRAVYIERCKYGSGANHGKPAAVRRQGARGLSPLPLMDIQGANLFFQLIARQYEKTSTVFTSNKTFSQWNGGLCRHHHCLRHSGSRPASLHRDQHKGRVLSPEGTQGIYAPETADRKHSFCARQHLIFVTPLAENYNISSAFSYNFKSALTILILQGFVQIAIFGLLLGTV